MKKISDFLGGLLGVVFLICYLIWWVGILVAPFILVAWLMGCL